MAKQLTHKGPVLKFTKVFYRLDLVVKNFINDNLPRSYPSKIDTDAYLSS